MPRLKRVKIRYNEEGAVRTTYELRERASRSQLRASASDRLRAGGRAARLPVALQLQ